VNHGLIALKSKKLRNRLNDSFPKRIQQNTKAERGKNRMDGDNLFLVFFHRAWKDEVILANKSDKKKYKPSLFRATWKTYGHRYCVIGAVLILYVCQFLVFARKK
jgi:hypothetical protein